MKSIVQKHIYIGEKHILGSCSRWTAVKADELDERKWLKTAAMCRPLAVYQIAHCGVLHARNPFEVVRLNLSGPFFLACIKGSGHILIDGDWQTVGEGIACMQPPYIPNALKANSSGVWSFCWVRYRGMSEQATLVAKHSPMLGQFNAASLGLAIEGLRSAAQRNEAAGVQQHWVDLVHSYVRLFAERNGLLDDRMAQIWNAVERQLQQDWTIERLCDLAGISREHLRRLSMQWTGRPPMQHLSYLRMRRAAELLATTADSIVSISRQVGYKNSFAFSDAFQKWMRFRPSAYRDKSHAIAPPSQ